ncbi:Predicted ester cyclase [Celeribacter indicus]|nr:Predicted ester cyclase [Celeribacter indicus]
MITRLRRSASASPADNPRSMRCAPFPKISVTSVRLLAATSARPASGVLASMAVVAGLRGWSSTAVSFVADQVQYNGTTIGLDGYRDMLVADFRAIPDLSFNIAGLVCDPPMIGSRLAFDCTPVGELFGLPVNGTRVRFDENVFYEFQEGKIRRVWSVIDKSSIAHQI